MCSKNAVANNAKGIKKEMEITNVRGLKDWPNVLLNTCKLISPWVIGASVSRDISHCEEYCPKTACG